jgi:hypothetical protein
MSRGQVPQDQANSRTFAIEAANNGVGEAWPAVMIDAYFTGSNALNARFGNAPTDVFNHQTWAPTRKIDPATAPAVQGLWVPGSSTSSGTWRQDDVTAECLARATADPDPDPDPDPEEDDAMSKMLLARDTTGALFAVSPDLQTAFALWSEDYNALLASGQYVECPGLRDDTIARIPNVVAVRQA